jgi:hypothetical protein
MKTFRTILFVGFLIILLSDCSKSDEPLQKTLIANYPLTSDGNDVTGFNEAMQLYNAPFQNGGIFCNGVYSPGPVFPVDPTPGACTAISPDLRFFNFHSFSISMDFFVTESLTQPVFVVGAGCRWLGFYLEEDGTVALLYNNSNYLASQNKYSLNEWHTAQITYDGITVKVFLDNAQACAMKFNEANSQLDYVGCFNATAIAVSNYSTGATLKGYVKNLVVYSPQ